MRRLFPFIGLLTALVLLATTVAGGVQPSTAKAQPATPEAVVPITDEARVTQTLFSSPILPGPKVYLPIIDKSFAGQPAPACEELIANGGFEAGTEWTLPVTPRPGRYTDELAHSASRSMLLGLKAGEADVRSYSSASQAVAIPAGANQVTLGFWLYPFSGLDSGDRQECLLLSESGQVQAILLRINSNAKAWERHAFDLSAYAGQTVRVYFNAYNDRDGAGTAGLFLDDVSVQACEEEVPVPPPVPDCYPVLWQSPEVGSTPHGAAVDGVAHRLYVANHGDDTLSILSTLSHLPVGTVAVGDGPNGVAYNPRNGRIYVANGGDDSVTVVRAGDQTPIATIPVGAQPYGVAVEQTHNWVYVTNWGDGTVSVIDAATNGIVRTVAAGAEPAMVAVHQGRSKAYVALHGAGRLAAINAAGGVTTIDLHSGGPFGVAVDEGRDLVYVATIDTGRIAVVDAATDAFLGWAEIRRMPGEEPVPLRQIAVNAAIGTSGHLFVTTAGEDGGWNRVLMLAKGWDEGFARAHALPLNEPREGIAFDPATQRVYVTSRSDDKVAVVLDGEPACPSNFAGEFRITVCVAGPEGSCR